MLAMVNKGPKNITIKEALKEARPFVWKYLWTEVLGGIIILGGLILLVVPGIIWAVSFSMTCWIVLLEGKTNWTALKASKELVKGYWWPVFGRGLLILCLSILLSIITSPFDRSAGGQSKYNIVRSIVDIVATPFTVAYLYNMYKSLRNIKKQPA